MEDINTSSSFKNVLFVNSAVFSLSDYINSDTIEIGYDTNVSTIIPSAKNHNNVTRIGFAFHFSGEDDDHEAFFTDLDLGESVETFSPNVQSMLDLLLGGGITHVDFLACGTLRSEKWKRYYQLLQSKTGVVIGASDDNTGNLRYGGDWVMESTMENIRDVYFTTAIENYAHLLVADFAVGGVLYRDQGGNKLLAVNFTNSSSLTHLDLPASVTNGDITYSVTSIGDGNPGTGFTKANSTLVSMSFPNTLVTFNKFTFRLGFIREFDLTNTGMVTFPEQFAHSSSAYLLKLPYTCTSLANDSFNNLQNLANSVYWNYPTPIQLTLPDKITTITGTPFHHTAYGTGNSYNAWGGRQNNVSLTTQKGIKLGSLIMYDASNNHYKYVGAIPYDILWGTTNTSGTDRSETLNNIIRNFKTSKTNTALWALTVITSVSFPDSTTLLYKLNTVIITADASNAASVRYSLNGGSDWITNTASPNTSIALPDGTYAIGAIKVICTSSDGDDSNTFTNSSAITIYLAGPIGLVVRYPSSTTLINNKVQSVILTTLPSDAVSWSYSTNSGSTWTVRDLTSSSFVLSETLYEVNSIQVKCANAFGNFGAIDYNTSRLIFDFGYNTYHHTYYTINVTNPTVLTRTTYNNAGTVVLDTQDISFGGMPIIDVLSLIDGGGTNPYAIGIVDSSLNKICMDIAYCGVYTKPLTDRQKTKLMTYVNTTFKEPHTYMTAIYTVTVNNGAFVFKNSLNVVVQTPISLTSGLVYLFDQSDSTNSENILRLSSTSPSLTEITSGVTKNGTPGTLNAYTIISPTSNLSVYGYISQQVTYTVTVDSGVYWISTNGATAVQKPHLIFESGTTYIFNQSHASNVGYPLQLTLHAGFPTTLSAYNYTSAPYTTGVVTTGTSFKISVDASTPQPLYYYCTNPGALMGYIPPLALIKYTFDISNGTVVANSGTATDGNGTLKYRAGTNVTNATGTTYSYNTSIFKRGSSSLFNNVYSSTSSYVQVKNMSLNSTEMTFCFWIRFTELNPGISCIPLSFENTTSGNNVRRLDIMSMVHSQVYYNNTFLNFTNTEVAHFFNTDGTDTKSFFEDTWRHLAITINTSTTRVKMYTDGGLRHNFTTNLITFPTTTGGFRILMGTPDGTGDFSSFKGHVDDYRIYNTTLTDAEILSIYHNTNYNF